MPANGDWLDETISIFNEYESPSRYYYWSLLAAVSAIVKDKVYWDKYLYRLYPNVFILLYGPSGVKKGPPIALAKDIVNKVGNTRVINGRASVEAIIKELGTVQTRVSESGERIIINDSSGFIPSSELSSSIIGSTSSLDIITDLFDRIFNNDKWGYRLKSQESVELTNPTITWLAGSNESLFREFVPEKNLKGGLIGRMFIISENKSNGINSLMMRPKIIPDRNKIACRIKHLANLEGEFEISDEIREAFNEWYIDFQTNKAPHLDDETGTVNRISDNICKVAMLISLARRGDMKITIEDLKEAMKEVLKLIIPTKKLVASAKQNDISIIEKKSLVLSYLANAVGHAATRVEILRKLTLKLDYEDLDRIILGLEQMRYVNVTRNGTEVLYALNMSNDKVREGIEEYKR